MNKQRRAGVAIAVIGSLTVGGGCARRDATATTNLASANVPAAIPNVQTATAQVGTILQVLPASAVLAAARASQATVQPSISGIIDALSVRFGQPVHKGQVLAHLSDSPILGQITQARATIAENQVQVEQAQANVLQQSAQTDAAIAEAKSSVAGAEATLSATRAQLVGLTATLSNAKENLTRLHKLYSDGLVAQKDVDAGQLALKTAESQVVSQQQTVQSQIKAVDGQQHAVEAAQTGRVQTLVKRKDVEIARQQVDGAVGTLANARAQLALYTIHSPLAGRVTNVGASIGEAVDTTTKIATIVNLDMLELQIAVPDEQSRLVRTGQAVQFSIDPSMTRYTTTIETIGSQIDPNNNTVTAVGYVKNANHKLKDGTVTKAQIILATHVGVVVVPKQAILTSPNGQTTVAVLGSGSVARVRRVKQGIVSGDRVEVVSGLRAGERVITVGAYGLPDGTTVKVLPQISEAK